MNILKMTHHNNRREKNMRFTTGWKKNKETNEALREKVLLDTDIPDRATISENITANKNTLADVSSGILPIDENSKTIPITDVESPEPPEMPSIWVGSPISPIPSPPCSHVDSTELNNEIVEFQVKGPNLQIVNL
jgi:hypothetical protein